MQDICFAFFLPTLLEKLHRKRVNGSISPKVRHAVFLPDRGQADQGCRVCIDSPQPARQPALLT